MRSKSNLVPPAQAAAAKEPMSGPGSAVCFCRVMDRRMKAAEAHREMMADVRESNDPQDCPAFADIAINDLGALDEFYEAMRNAIEHGAEYRIRVALVGDAK